MGLTPVIELKGVSKWYGNFRALRHIDLRIAHGERLVVCGPSGSGKSTLIRCINRLEAPDEGEVLIDGVRSDSSAAALARVRREVGMVFQQFNLFPHLTVLENCTLAPVHVSKAPEAEARERALDLLARVRLSDQAYKFPAQLSGGQKQRVAIARALCMQPRVLLFDEPTSALDPVTIGDVLDVMLDLARSGITMVCVTHEMGFARNVADRVLFMESGQILEDAPPHQFFSTPRHERVRQFLGQMLQI